MTEPFFIGVLSAWALGQLAVGLFFLIAYASARREAEFLLFAVLCVTVGVATASIGASYGIDVDLRPAVSLLSLMAAILAGVVHLHFVIRYTAASVPKWLLPAAYACAGLIGIGFLSPLGTASLQLVETQAFALQHQQAIFKPSLLAWVFTIVLSLELIAAPVLLFRSFGAGKREAMGAAIGAVIVTLAVAHDMLLLNGVVENSVYLLPHGFLPYCFAIASTFLSRYRDATRDLQAAVERLEQSTDELKLSHVELEEMQGELVKKRQLAAVGELAAAIAHEVRNPLAVIVNAVSGLRRPTQSVEDRQTLLDIIQEETARLNRLVTDLLRFARPVNIHRSQLSLIELTSRPQITDASNQRVEVSIPDDRAVQSVWVDPGLFRLVFDNLVSNARQAMPDGGLVKVVVSSSTLQAQPAVRIDITDTGKGMDPEVLGRAVDPFFTTRPSGTGLGLPIVERIIEAHGGEFNIESEPGKGTTVTILLPAGDPDAMDLQEGNQSRSE